MLAQAPLQNAPLTQVTLTLHQPILEMAEQHAKAHNTDISHMIEGYFSSFLGQNYLSKNDNLNNNLISNSTAFQP